MIESAGIAIIYENKILLAHATNGGRQMWGIPKGKVEEGEDYSNAASRETKEEIGIYIDPKKLKNASIIRYKNKKTKKTYKRIFYFLYYIKSLEEISLDTLNVDKSQLQLTEIDKAKFMTKDEAEEFMFWRQKEILKNLK